MNERRNGNKVLMRVSLIVGVLHSRSLNHLVENLHCKFGHLVISLQHQGQSHVGSAGSEQLAATRTDDKKEQKQTTSLRRRFSLSLGLCSNVRECF